MRTGYIDATGSPWVTVQAGQTYAVEIDAPGERVYSYGETITTFGTVWGSLTIPTTAFNGIMHGRMIMRFKANPALCGPHPYGTTIDFRLQAEGGRSSPSQQDLPIATLGDGRIVSNPPGIEG